MITFSRINAVQGFFMIAFVYLKERRKSKKTRMVRSRNVYLTSILIIFVNALTYGFSDSMPKFMTSSLFALEKCWSSPFTLACCLMACRCSLARLSLSRKMSANPTPRPIDMDGRTHAVHASATLLLYHQTVVNLSSFKGQGLRPSQKE